MLNNIVSTVKTYANETKTALVATVQGINNADSPTAPGLRGMGAVLLGAGYLLAKLVK